MTRKRRSGFWLKPITVSAVIHPASLKEAGNVLIVVKWFGQGFIINGDMLQIRF
jgi:hypothetical protein